MPWNLPLVDGRTLVISRPVEFRTAIDHPVEHPVERPPTAHVFSREMRGYLREVVNGRRARARAHNTQESEYVPREHLLSDAIST
jgi:hypothetical protein